MLLRSRGCLREAHPLRERGQWLGRNGKCFSDLRRSNPTQCNIRYPQGEVLRAFSTPGILHYSPDPNGLLSARETVAQYYADKKLCIDPSRIFMQASTSEAYSNLFKILCNPGDSVLIPKPSYPLFEYLAELNNVRLIYYPLRYDGEWHIDLDALAKAIDSSVKAVVIINPHNPTGSFLKRNELAGINALAAEHGLALVVDEVFIDYGFKEDPNRYG